jgi:hypothetical protein
MTIHVLIQNGAIERQLAKLLREILARDHFADATVLREQLEAEARRLGLVATRDRIERALDLVASNRQLLAANKVAPRAAVPATPPPAPTSPRDAKATLERYGIDVSGGAFRPRRAPSRLVPL